MLWMMALSAVSAQETYMLELPMEVDASEIVRATTWVRVATGSERSLGEVRVDCRGDLRCRVTTSRLGELRVTDAAFVSTRVGDGVEVGVIANGSSHWLWLEPNPSP